MPDEDSLPTGLVVRADVALVSFALNVPGSSVPAARAAVDTLVAQARLGKDHHAKVVLTRFDVHAEPGVTTEIQGFLQIPLAPGLDVWERLALLTPARDRMEGHLVAEHKRTAAFHGTVGELRFALLDAESHREALAGRVASRTATPELLRIAGCAPVGDITQRSVGVDEVELELRWMCAGVTPE